MKLKVEATRNKRPIYEGIHEVIDARSFGEALSDMWTNLTETGIQGASNVGALYEVMEDHRIPNLDGVQITLKRIGS